MFRKILVKAKQKLSNKKKLFIENLKNKKLIYPLNQIYKLSNINQKKYKSLLIDGGYYNLNYFYRLQLVRASIKSNIIKEYAYIWDSNENLCKKILQSIGIKNISFFKVKLDKEISLRTENIFKKISFKEDIINSGFDTLPVLRFSISYSLLILWFIILR